MTYNITTVQLTVFILLALWELVWKGVALWRASHRGQPYWFAALLVINSAGLFPILYLLLTTFYSEGPKTQYHKTPLLHGR